MNLHPRLFIGSAGVLLAGPVAAAIVWTGAVNNDFWFSGNWSGGAPVPNTATTDSIEITSAAGTITAATGAGSLVLGDGFSFAVVSSTVEFNNNGIMGEAGGLPNAVTLDSAAFAGQYLTTGVEATLLNVSALTLRGQNRAINSLAEISSVSLSEGSAITYASGNNELSEVTSGLDRGNAFSIFNLASGVSWATDNLTAPLTAFAISGSDLTPFKPNSGGNGVNEGAFTITAIPEPAAGSIVAAAVAALLGWHQLRSAPRFGLTR